MPLTAEALAERLQESLGDLIANLTVALDEVTLEVGAANLMEAAVQLRDAPELRFDTLIDLCGIDYLDYRDGGESRFKDGPRFAAVIHLLSVRRNQRVRVRVFAPDDVLPVVPSVHTLWPTANWFERECFDLFGIVFEGHPDMRRILTDYGFIGHPFRKDFPLSGHVEMRYDPEQRRVIYQPVSIEPREVTPRIVRDESYGAGRV